MIRKLFFLFVAQLEECTNGGTWRGTWDLASDYWHRMVLLRLDFGYSIVILWKWSSF